MSSMNEIKFNNHIIQIIKGNLIKEETTAIVNPANSMLKHGGGVARAISIAGGRTIQAESDEYVRKNGEIPVGHACILSGGNMPAKYVIHTVGPIWGSGDEDNKLKSAIVSSLKLCDGNGIKSISIPAISSGIFGFPKERCARIFFETLKEYFEKKPNSVIKLVRLCNIDDETYFIFLKESEKYK